MDFQKLTIKAQEAFASAQGDAIARGNPELTPEHLLAALVDQEGGVAPRILEKAGEGPAALRARLDEQLSRLPRMQFERPPFEYPIGLYKADPRKALDPKPVLNPLA